MKIYLISIALAVTAVSYPLVSMGGHIEGMETNVVMIACLIEEDAPYRIDVVASSVNMTKNPIPIVSRKNSCAQALHELMTSGFEITESSLEELTFVFVLTRQDQSKEKH